MAVLNFEATVKEAPKNEAPKNVHFSMNEDVDFNRLSSQKCTLLDIAASPTGERSTLVVIVGYTPRHLRVQAHAPAQAACSLATLTSTNPRYGV